MIYYFNFIVFIQNEFINIDTFFSFSSYTQMQRKHELLTYYAKIFGVHFVYRQTDGQMDRKEKKIIGGPIKTQSS